MRLFGQLLDSCFLRLHRFSYFQRWRRFDILGLRWAVISLQVVLLKVTHLTAIIFVQKIIGFGLVDG